MAWFLSTSGGASAATDNGLLCDCPVTTMAGGGSLGRAPSRVLKVNFAMASALAACETSTVASGPHSAQIGHILMGFRNL